MNLKILQIRKSSEFKTISNKGKKFSSKHLVLLAFKTPDFYQQNILEGKNAKDFCRIGYTVSKTVGNSVIRNLVKRRLREAFKVLAKKYAKPHHDYVLIARKEILNLEYKELFSDLEFCLKGISRISASTKNDQKK